MTSYGRTGIQVRAATSGSACPDAWSPTWWPAIGRCPTGYASTLPSVEDDRTLGARGVRVTDILELLANGATHSHILADYPYLTEADLRAALAFGAAAAGHRVILTA